MSSWWRRRPDEYKNRPDTELWSGFLRRAKWVVVMRDSQCLDTDLERRSDFTGSRIRISVKRSSLVAISSAEDVYSDMKALKEFEFLLFQSQSPSLTGR